MNYHFSMMGEADVVNQSSVAQWGFNRDLEISELFLKHQN
jgi:hypothetical protein